MRGRHVAGLAAITAAALLAAFLSWRHPHFSTSASPILLAASTGSLQRIHFDDGTHALDLVKEGGAQSRWWLTLAPPPGATEPDGGQRVAFDDDAGTPRPLNYQETPAGTRAEQVLQAFAPLRAVRDLGMLSKERLGELGLSNQKRRLEIVTGGILTRFIASDPREGIIGAYLMNAEGRVYLVDSHFLTALDPTSNALVDRRLHPWPETDINFVLMAMGEKNMNFVRMNGPENLGVRFARVSSPTEVDSAFTAWHEKVWNDLVVTRVLGRAEIPAVGVPQRIFILKYSRTVGSAAWLEFAEDSTGAFWARSESTASWNGISAQAASIIREGRRLAP